MYQTHGPTHLSTQVGIRALVAHPRVNVIHNKIGLSCIPQGFTENKHPQTTGSLVAWRRMYAMTQPTSFACWHCGILRSIPTPGARAGTRPRHVDSTSGSHLARSSVRSQRAICLQFEVLQVTDVLFPNGRPFSNLMSRPGPLALLRSVFAHMFVCISSQGRTMHTMF
jgi:hypothetical protein